MYWIASVTSACLDGSELKTNITPPPLSSSATPSIIILLLSFRWARTLCSPPTPNGFRVCALVQCVPNFAFWLSEKCGPIFLFTEKTPSFRFS